MPKPSPAEGVTPGVVPSAGPGPMTGAPGGGLRGGESSRAKTLPTGLDVALAVASKTAGVTGTNGTGTANSALAGAAALMPRAPSAETPRAGAAFLTPRVVDQRAFEDFAGHLRQLAADADARAAALAEISANAERSIQAAADSARQHRAAVEVLGKLLHALNARAGEVGELVTKFDDRLRAVQEAERRIESAAERVMDRFEARFAARLEEIARGPAAAAVGELIDDAERVKDELGAAARRMAELRASASDATDHFTGLVARSRVEASALAERAEKAGESLSKQLRAADDVGTRAFQRITEAADAAAPLESLLGSCARADSSLRERLRDADRVREESAGIAQQLAALLHKADASREELRSWAGLLGVGGSGAIESTGQGPTTPARLPEPLERIVREFRTSLAQDLSKMAGAMALIARRAETSVRRGPDGGPEIVIRAGGVGEPSRTE
ncbi:MAG: hypothetical protein ACKVZJ_04550 [Phycisphaerales bacterium]